MESAVLKKNPYLKNILENAEFIWDKPQVIHEISFSPKELIHNHILMAGDSAGLISPLCGNGMAIALHSGKLVGESILEWIDRGMISSERTLLERKYVQNWNKQFRTRLWIGRQIQKVFGEDLITHYTLGFLSRLPALTQVLIDSTHGDIF
jgi:flavin-dependent dehydrogenase